MYNGDPSECSGDLVHQVRIWIDLRLHVWPLEHCLCQPAELHRVGGEDGLGVALDEAGGVDQVPEPVGVDNKRNTVSLDLKDKQKRGDSVSYLVLEKVFVISSG